MCFENVTCMAFYIEKIGVWNISQMMWDLFQTISLMQKNFSFIISGTLTCVRMIMYAYVGMKHAYVGLEHA